MLMMKGGYRATFNKCDELEDFNTDVSAYDKIVIASPIWNDRLTPAINSVLKQIDLKDNEFDIEKITETYDKTIVTVDSMNDSEINSWIDTGKAFGKAGAYAIQEEFGRFIKKIDGDYCTSVGLPVNKLYNILKDLEVYDGI